jgi:flagellar basal body-associated protein FliL
MSKLASGSFKRILLLAVALVALILGGIAATAWLSSGEESDLPFEYEGFD